MMDHLENSTKNYGAVALPKQSEENRTPTEIDGKVEAAAARVFDALEGFDPVESAGVSGRIGLGAVVGGVSFGVFGAMVGFALGPVAPLTISFAAAGMIGGGAAAVKMA